MLLMTILACLTASDRVDVGPDSEVDTDVDTDTDSEPDTDVDRHHVSGRVSFQAPLPGCQAGCGLDYAGAIELPVRFHRIALLDGAGGVLTESTTASDGTFELIYDGSSPSATLYVFADAVLPNGMGRVTLTDNTDGLDWGSPGGTIDLTSSTTNLNLVIEDGWNGSSYSHRASGPFAISNAVLQVSEALLSVAPETVLPPLRVYWSPDNRPEYGDEEQGLIGTSFYRGSEVAIYLLGAANIDTDEFDRHIVLHEWTHYFQHQVSRSDSSGGAHPYGAVLDPTVAWSEGSATVVASLVYDEVPYTDTRGPAQQGGFDNAIEDDEGNLPGWWSERAVQRWVNDVYDGTSESGDTVELGLPAMWTDLIDQHDAAAFVTLFSFADAVAREHPEVADELDAFSERFGISPVQDALGSGELHDGGWAANLPVYVGLESNDQTLHFDGTLNYNRLGRHRFLSFVGAGRMETVSVTSEEDVDLRIYASGVQIGSSRDYCSSPPCTESVTLSTTNGTLYTALVEGYGDPADYTATVRIAP